MGGRLDDREPEDDDPDHYAMYSIGKIGDERMLRLVRSAAYHRLDRRAEC